MEVNEDLQPQLFKNREQARGACQQNNLPETAIVQLYRQKNIASVEVAEVAEVETPVAEAE